jgi:hypothetical protein
MSGVLATCACGIVAFLVVARSGLAEAFIRSSTVQDRLHDTDRMLTSELYTALVRASAGWLWMGACAALATFCAAWHLYRSRPTIAASLVAMAWLALFRTYLRDILPVLEPLREQRSIASAAHEFVPPDAPVYYYGREDQQLMYYLGPRMRWLLNRTQLLPVITQPDPVFVVMELERFEMRQNDWPDVTMVPVARNTENAFGTHRSPAVLVTNATGWRLVQSRRGGIGERLAN